MRVIRPGISAEASRRLLWALGAAGMLFTIVLARRVGGQVLLSHLAALGPSVPLILLLTGLRYPLQTAAWRLALKPAERPPWPQAIAATLAGNAVSYLTFVGPIAGEPARAMLLRGHTAFASGIAAGAVERALYASTGTFLTAAGVAVAASRLGHGRQLNAVIWWTAAAVFVLIVAVRTVMRRRRARAPDATPQWASAWRETVGDLWRTRRTALGGLVLLSGAQHALLLAEAAVILHALGVPAGAATVLVFESLTKAANSIATFVPAGAGVTEGGSALLAASLGIGAHIGLALALVRRARALAWAVAGLAVLAVVNAPSLSGRSRAILRPPIGVR